MRGEEEKKEETTTLKDVARNVRFIHMQINTPKTGNKTRASKMKEALMIIFATSKYIKLHPKEEGMGEIINNIDDLVTTEEFTNQYFFDKKMGGKKYVRGEGSVDYYSTKVRLETDISLSQMKWKTSAKFLEALKVQNIFLKEYNDGPVMRTGNLGWLSGINPANTSIAKTTKDMNKVLEAIKAKVIIDTHTVSIRFPEKKTAFVTRAYKVMCNIEKLEEARELVRLTLSKGKMGVGWERVNLVNFNIDKRNTAMMIEAHNKLLHNTAVVAIKNIWSITEKEEALAAEIKTKLGMENDEVIYTLEDMWWNLANRYKQDVQGMVTRRGTLEILTTRQNLNDTVRFAKELVSNTLDVLGEDFFAKLTANHNIYARKPKVQESPLVLAGKGRVKLDTSLFTEEEFKLFAQKHGITTGEDKEKVQEINVDLTRPPKAFYYKPGREPVEHDPTTMREGARKVWEKFTEKEKKKKRQSNEAGNEEEKLKERKMVHEINLESESDKIAQTGKMIRLESTMAKMKESQESLEKSAEQYQTKLQNMQKAAEDNMERMTSMINSMGEAITAQNKQLEAQAKAQIKQAEDIEVIMKAIQAISKAVQVTPTASQEEGAEKMQIDIAESNAMKRKQSSTEPTTLRAAELESTSASSTPAESHFKGMRSTGGR